MLAEKGAEIQRSDTKPSLAFCTSLLIINWFWHAHWKRCTFCKFFFTRILHQSTNNQLVLTCSLKKAMVCIRKGFSLVNELNHVIVFLCSKGRHFSSQFTWVNKMTIEYNSTYAWWCHTFWRELQVEAWWWWKLKFVRKALRCLQIFPLLPRKIFLEHH